MPKKKIINKEFITTTLKKRGPRSNQELRDDLGLTTQTYDPKLDRTLQQLRKEGEVHIIKGKWSIATTKICPTCEGKGWID